MSDFSNCITNLDLKNVMARVARDFGLSGETLTAAETQYRQFLQLCLEDTGSVPTELADKVWHCHILDTRKYAADCEAIFGKLLHHTPHLEATAELEAETAATQAAWAKKFQAASLCTKSALCSK